MEFDVRNNYLRHHQKSRIKKQYGFSDFCYISVIYRRWQSKSKLVLVALHKHVLDPYNNDVPDTGDLRNDILILLMRIAKPLQIIGAETLHGLIIEHISEDSIPSIQQIMNVELRLDEDIRHHEKDNKSVFWSILSMATIIKGWIFT